MLNEKKPHEYWYYFGRCTPFPKQIRKGTLPNPPYKRFDTKEECEKYIKDNKTPFLNNIANAKVHF